MDDVLAGLKIGIAVGVFFAAAALPIVAIAAALHVAGVL